VPELRWGLTLPFGGVPHAPLVRRAEAAGYDDLWSADTNGPDGFTPLALAAAWTERVRLGTNFLPLSDVEDVVARVRKGEAAAGREPTEVICRFFCVPGEGGLDVARSMLAAYGTVPVYEAFFRAHGWGDALDPMVRAWRAGDRRLALERAPEALIREIFVFGSPPEQRERLLEFAARGTTTLVLSPIAPPERLPDLVDALAP
jgi:alkanesulfonate monooxygenase SsuD/methylene tetrahydromethanopterin reductase-like flavin-dependent oxidoreductase (luciferase family)